MSATITKVPDSGSFLDFMKYEITCNDIGNSDIEFHIGYIIMIGNDEVTPLRIYNPYFVGHVAPLDLFENCKSFVETSLPPITGTDSVTDSTIDNEVWIKVYRQEINNLTGEKIDPVLVDQSTRQYFLNRVLIPGVNYGDDELEIMTLRPSIYCTCKGLYDYIYVFGSYSLRIDVYDDNRNWGKVERIVESLGANIIPIGDQNVEIGPNFTLPVGGPTYGLVTVYRDNITKIVVTITKNGTSRVYTNFVKDCCNDDTETLLHLSVNGGYEGIGMKRVTSFSTSRDYTIINKFNGGRSAVNLKSNSIRLFEMEVDYKKDSIPWYESMIASGNFIHRRDIIGDNGYYPEYHKFLVNSGQILHNRVDDTTVLQINGFYSERINNQGSN